MLVVDENKEETKMKKKRCSQRHEAWSNATTKTTKNMSSELN